MKRRILSLLLLLTMLLTVVQTNTALAEDNLQLGQETISEWTYEDLIIGDTYGIYPASWYNKGMQKPITHGQFRTLISGFRYKMINTDRIIDEHDVTLKLSANNKKMTVKEALEILYSLVSSYEFDGDIGIKENGNAVDFMTSHGIYTGKGGEQALDEKCSVEQACVIATRLVTYIYDVLDAGSKGFLWEINSAGNTVYLLGSIHVADYDIYPFSNKMLEAFASADALGVEVDILNPSLDTTEMLLNYGFYTDGSTLKDHVSEETYELVVELGEMIGLSEDLVSIYKPWLLYLTFDVMASINPESDEDLSTAAALGIDTKFLVDAYMKDKPIIELEGADYQYNVLNSFSEELQELLLQTSMYALLEVSEEGTGDNSNFLSKALDYWKMGDVESFLKITSSSTDLDDQLELTDEDKKIQELFDEYYDKMITQRDKGMANKIDQMLKEEGNNTYFVVVGSAHYISDYSVLDMLEEMGYEINQIK